jgi:hypothetical protein
MKCGVRTSGKTGPRRFILMYPARMHLYHLHFLSLIVIVGRPPM